jgi:hypothetical protein
MLIKNELNLYIECLLGYKYIETTGFLWIGVEEINWPEIHREFTNKHKYNLYWKLLLKYYYKTRVVHSL